MLKSIKYLILFLPILTFGQGADKALTKAEQFSLQSGVLIEKQFIEIGKLNELEIKVLKLKDLNSLVTYSALRFELSTSDKYSSDTKIVSLDKDEIDDLVKSIKNLQTNVFPTTREIYTEITFRSKTGFEAGAYYTVDRAKWSAYIQLDRYSRDNMLFLKTEDFETLLNLITRAKQKM